LRQVLLHLDLVVPDGNYLTGLKCALVDIRSLHRERLRRPARSAHSSRSGREYKALCHRGQEPGSRGGAEARGSGSDDHLTDIWDDLTTRNAADSLYPYLRSSTTMSDSPSPFQHSAASHSGLLTPDLHQQPNSDVPFSRPGTPSRHHAQQIGWVGLGAMGYFMSRNLAVNRHSHPYANSYSHLPSLITTSAPAPLPYSCTTGPQPSPRSL
jgi:hypothetical protein